MSNKFNFDDVSPEETPFSYKGTEYVLREISAGNRRLHDNERGNRITYGSDGDVQSIRNAGDLKLLLVRLCLTKADGSKVSESTIETWPDKFISELFEESKRLSNIDQPATIEFLDKRINALQEIRTKMVADQENKASEKNS